tara:strand:- start:15300 stop:15479 length:180 start_codon:yes stop_codon:yes gene_type:complete
MENNCVYQKCHPQLIKASKILNKNFAKQNKYNEIYEYAKNEMLDTNVYIKLMKCASKKC